VADSKDPFSKFKQNLSTHFNARKLENRLLDFDIDTFKFQTKEIYDDVYNALEYKEFPILARSLHTDLYEVIFDYSAK
jgi:hypothetical protein